MLLQQFHLMKIIRLYGRFQYMTMQILIMFRTLSTVESINILAEGVMYVNCPVV
jgi:hypothetical protein